MSTATIRVHGVNWKHARMVMRSPTMDRSNAVEVECGEDVAIGSAFLTWEPHNRAWAPSGDSLDCWVSRSILDWVDRHPEYRDSVLTEIRDWQERTVSLTADEGEWGGGR
jgi:hypothetical protein